MGSVVVPYYTAVVIKTISVHVNGLVIGMVTDGEEVGSAVPILYTMLVKGLGPNVTLVAEEHQGT